MASCCTHGITSHLALWGPARCGPAGTSDPPHTAPDHCHFCPSSSLTSIFSVPGMPGLLPTTSHSTKLILFRGLIYLSVVLPGCISPVFMPQSTKLWTIFLGTTITKLSLGIYNHHNRYSEWTKLGRVSSENGFSSTTDLQTWQNLPFSTSLFSQDSSRCQRSLVRSL